MTVMINHSKHVLWDVDLEASRIWACVSALQSYWMAVPILFFVSGMLVSLSLKNSSHWLEFFLKRILRIYPALWSCVLLSTAILLLLGHATISPTFLMWFGAQMTLFQFWTPDVMRDYGVGTPNGSLWVIPIIFQSYLLYAFLPRIHQKLKGILGKHAPLFVLLLAIILRQVCLQISDSYTDALFVKLLGISLLPWFLFFYSGYVCVLYFENLMSLRIPTYVLVSLYLASVFLLNTYIEGFPRGNKVNSFVFLMLSLVLFKLAYVGDYRISVFTKIEKLLRKYDVTFGIFIFHLVVANLIHEYQLIDSIALRLITYFAVTFAIAFFSLICLEKPLRDNRMRIIHAITSRVLKPK